MSQKSSSSMILDDSDDLKSTVQSLSKRKKDANFSKPRDSSSSSPGQHSLSETSSPNSSGTFNERNFLMKLENVMPTQESIQSLGLWIIHNKIHHEVICRIWIDKLSDSRSSKMYIKIFFITT